MNEYPEIGWFVRMYEGRVEKIQAEDSARRFDSEIQAEDSIWRFVGESARGKVITRLGVPENIGSVTKDLNGSLFIGAIETDTGFLLEAIHEHKKQSRNPVY